MPIQSQRAKAIDAYIKAHINCVRGKQKVEIKGQIEYKDSYMLPLNLLLYNHDNRRYNLEIQEYETRLDRKLDPSDKKDVKIIKELLLQDKTEAEKLYNDLKQLGEQREVAAITHDGIVINGNRRMATIEELHIKDNPNKWDELWVVRLPEDISDKDLWKIEAGLQLSKEKVADYGPINNLLMIKEGKKAGLSPSEIAASMYGWSSEAVEFDLERLDLIDTFLIFMAQPNNYGLIKKFFLNEHFIDIQNYLLKKTRSMGTPKREVTKKIEKVFLYLRARITDPSFKFTHYDARDICKILIDVDASAALTESFDKYDDLRKIPPKSLEENFDKATDVKKSKEDREKPAKLIGRAITALSSIDRRNKHFKSDADVKSRLKELDKIVKDMKSELGINL